MYIRSVYVKRINSSYELIPRSLSKQQNATTTTPTPRHYHATTTPPPRHHHAGLHEHPQKAGSMTYRRCPSQDRICQSINGPGDTAGLYNIRLANEAPRDFSHAFPIELFGMTEERMEVGDIRKDVEEGRRWKRRERWKEGPA